MPLLDASHLTDQSRFREQKEDLWSPWLFEFLTQYKPSLAVWECLPYQQSRKFTRRSPFPEIRLSGDIRLDPGYPFLQWIESIFRVSLVEDPDRYAYRALEGKKCDLARILPDILAIRPNGVTLIENRPYPYSPLTSAQEDDYLGFCRWMTKRGISVELLFVSPQAWAKRQFDALLTMQSQLLGGIGLVWYEDILAEMADANYRYADIQANWEDFTRLDLESIEG